MSMTAHEQALAVASDSTRDMTSQKIANLIGGFLLLEAALWTPKPYQTVLSFLTLAYVIASVVWRGHSVVEIGLSPRFLRRGWRALIAALGLCALMLVVAWWIGTLHIVPRANGMIAGALLYLVWSLEQEFMLQAFFFLGLKPFVGTRTALVSSAVLFGIAHLPNPILTVATLLGGIFFTAVFARYQNLAVVAVVHALLGITLAMTAPDSVNHHMRVGLGYLRHNVGIAPTQPPVPVEPRRASFVGRDQFR